MSFITSVATAIPPHQIAQKEIVKAMQMYLPLSEVEKRKLGVIYKASAIDYRYSVLETYTQPHFDKLLGETAPTTAKRMAAYQQYAPALSLQASSKVLAQRNLPATAITHLITFSCTGFYAPGLDIDLVQGLGLPTDTPRWHIGFMGCYATFNALRLADLICQADKNAKVLLAGVELCTLHLQHSNTEDALLSGALFGDGAASALVESTITEKMPSLAIEALHSEFYNNGANDMAWKIGNTGFDMRLSSYVPDLVQGEISGLIDRLLAKVNWKFSEIEHFAVHPGGRRILEAVEKALAISPAQNAHSYDVLRRYGNMSSVTVLFVLQQLMAQITPQDAGKRVLAMAFGPGLTIETGLLKIVA